MFYRYSSLVANPPFLPKRLYFIYASGAMHPRRVYSGEYMCIFFLCLFLFFVCMYALFILFSSMGDSPRFVRAHYADLRLHIYDTQSLCDTKK